MQVLSARRLVAMPYPRRVTAPRFDDGPELRSLPFVYAGSGAAWLVTTAAILWAVGTENRYVVMLASALLFISGSAWRLRVMIANAAKARAGRDRVMAAIATLTDPSLMRLELEELIDELLQRARSAIAADLVGVVMVDEVDGGLTIAFLRDATGVEHPSSAPVDGILASLVRNAESVLVGETRAEDVAGALRGRPIESFAGCPMQIDGRVLGAVFATSTSSKDFDLESLRFLQRVADRVAMALERARLDDAGRAGRKALAEGEARLRTLVEVAPMGILEVSLDGEVERWNRAATELFEWPPFLEGAAAPPLQGEVASRISALVRSARRGLRRETGDARVERGNAPPITVALTAAPLIDRDDVLRGVIVLLSDVSERRQLEQHIRQSQRLDAMSRLAGGVAHDFNNLLTVILGYSQFLLQQLPAESELREDVEAIEKAGQRASALTNQLLTIGRRQVVEPVVLDVQAQVRDLEPIIRRLVGDAIDLRVVVGRGAAAAKIDPHEFEQVVMNLCINARDAMPQGGRLVLESRRIELDAEAATAASVSPGDYVLITVADTGTGMSESVREHCFDPFFTTKGRGKGTGLGLAAVYGVVTQAGGHIDVVSDPGRGTTFRLYLPVSLEPVSAEQAKGTAGSRSRRKARTGRILLVEDEDAVRTLAKAVLEEQGHEVVDVDSAEAALTLARRVRRPFDVLVSDIVMRGMHGDALAREVSDLWADVKILLVSGYVERAAALDADRVSFLAKPFALDELSDRVAELLGPEPRKRPASKKPAPAKPPSKAPSKAPSARTAKAASKAASPRTAKAADGSAGAVRARSDSRRREPSRSAEGASGRARSPGGRGERAP